MADGYRSLIAALAIFHANITANRLGIFLFVKSVYNI